MKLEKMKWLLAFGCALAAAPSQVQAQCQRGGGQTTQSAGNSTQTASTTPYGLTSLANGYSQNTLSSNPYNNGAFLSQMAAAEQYHQNMRQYTAMRAQANGIMVRTQMADTKAQRKAIEQSSAQLRKQRDKERAEALAVREERLAARRAKEYEQEKPGAMVSTRLASN